MPAAEGGLVTSYTAAMAGSPGTLVFSYKYARVIAAGTSIEVQVGGYACVKRGLDTAGDAVITGSMVCGGVRF